VTEGTGITVSGTSVAPVVNIDYAGTDNAILSATQYLGTDTLPDTCQIWFNDPSNAVANTVLYAPISDLPFDAYSSWTADSDEGTDITVTSGFNLKFTGAVTAGGAGIATDSAVSANEMTIGLINAGGTPGATTFYRGDGQWSVPVGTKTETLAEVLVNGNTTGGTDIAVSAADDITFTDTSKALFGAGSDLQIYHDGSDSYIKEINTTASGSLFILSDLIYIRTNSGNQTSANFSSNVQLFYLGSQRFATTSTGVSVTGGGTFTGDITAAVGTFKAPAASASIINAFQADDGNNAATFRTTTTGYVFEIRSQNSGTIKIDTSLATFTGNVEIDGDLTVDGIIKHGPGGSGGGTAKGGIFSKLYTTGAIGASGIAFTITRNSDAAMVFDVMFTGGGVSSATSTCKKYTVAKKYGTTSASVYYNKIIDTGPASGGSGTADYDILFDVSGSSGDAIECNITAVGVATQQVGITINLGLGNSNAVVVMN
jgi:hypothetical protein